MSPEVEDFLLWLPILGLWLLSGWLAPRYPIPGNSPLAMLAFGKVITGSAFLYAPFVANEGLGAWLPGAPGVPYLLALCFVLLWGYGHALIATAGFLILADTSTTLRIPERTQKSSTLGWAIFGSIAGLLISSRVPLHGESLASRSLGLLAISLLVWAIILGLSMWFELTVIRKRLTSKPDQDS
jgi:hypothetical protein